MKLERTFADQSRPMVGMTSTLLADRRVPLFVFANGTPIASPADVDHLPEPYRSQALAFVAGRTTERELNAALLAERDRLATEVAELRKQRQILGAPAGGRPPGQGEPAR